MQFFRPNSDGDESGNSAADDRAERIRQGREERLRAVLSGALRFLALLAVAGIIAVFVITRGNSPRE
jgi:hypothetical protein